MESSLVISRMIVVATPLVQVITDDKTTYYITIREDKMTY